MAKGAGEVSRSSPVCEDPVNLVNPVKGGTLGHAHRAVVALCLGGGNAVALAVER